MNGEGVEHGIVARVLESHQGVTLALKRRQMDGLPMNDKRYAGYYPGRVVRRPGS